MMGMTPSTTTVAATVRVDQAEPLRHHIAHLSLMHGWLSAPAQAITAVVLACAIGWRSRHWRMLSLPTAVAVGLVSAVSAHYDIESIG